MRRHLQSFAVLILLLAFIPALSAQSGKDTILKASDITPTLFPEKVFFRGQVTTTQLRNTGGVHFADDFYLLAGLADVSGYSGSLQEKFQGYLLSEVPLEIGGQKLKPGAYGFGFRTGGHFAVLDLGARDVLQTSLQNDAQLKRPVPLQIVAAAKPGTYRLYSGRNFVEIKRAQ